MNALSDFILRQIVKQATLSTKEGKAKYRAYFINTPLYAARREEVDEALRAAGYSKIILQSPQ